MKVTLGPQKKSRVIDEKDKYDTAIHESGHAIVSKLSKEKSPVHEVSIIPRGGAGGYTVSTDDDATVYFREKLLSKIQMLLGGITAEKLYIGDISTGASNDLKRATNIARRMVTEWGMSAELGMVYCGSDDEVFIGKTYQERMPYSEDQAAKIDLEVKKIIELCQKETEKILVKNKKVILTMAEVLMEKETIYAEEVDMILAGKNKEEVIKYIENKDKKPEKSEPEEKKGETAAENETKPAEPAQAETKPQTSTDLVNELLKVAEEREKAAESKKEMKTEEQKPQAEGPVAETPEKVSKPQTKKRTTKSETKSSENEKKTSAKKTTAKAKTTKTTLRSETTKNRKKSTKNTEKIDKIEDK